MLSNAKSVRQIERHNWIDDLRVRARAQRLVEIESGPERTPAEERLRYAHVDMRLRDHRRVFVMALAPAPKR